MDTTRSAASAGRLRRLADELDDDGFGFLVAGDASALLLEELDYALRPPVHERRVPSYGAIIDPARDVGEWRELTELRVERRPTADYRDAQIRRFADGISSFAVRFGGGVDELVVFDRPAGSERDLVVLAAATRGLIVQRHPLGVVRVIGDHGVVRHDVAGWQHEPPLGSLLAHVPGCLGATGLTALGRVLDFAVHDLGSRGIGALVVFHPSGTVDAVHERRLPEPPALRIDRPHDLAPLRHAMSQTDGATVFDHSGTLREMGIRLVPSALAETEVRPLGGTRHTSARRFSFDDPAAVVVTVSDDGPVTVFRSGDIIGRSDDGPATPSPHGKLELR